MELLDILLIDKPSGMTSFDVIRFLRKATGVRKFGHAGTLDPLASGLMILGVEAGTKKLAELIKLDKEYIAEVRLGEERTTDDLEGAIVREADVHEIDQAVLKDAVAQMVGSHELAVSAYSAIKQQGTPLYKKARAAERAGTTLDDLPMRTMVVYEAELQGTRTLVLEGKHRFVATIRFKVASGVYIRSLARELGRLLQVPATLQALRRTKIGSYAIEEAKPLSAFTHE